MTRKLSEYLASGGRPRQRRRSTMQEDLSSNCGSISISQVVKQQHQHQNRGAKNILINKIPLKRYCSTFATALVDFYGLLLPRVVVCVIFAVLVS